MPWLRELAHYEWAELALQISEATREDIVHDARGDLLAGCPLPSPLAWPLAYAWPVHRIGPDHQPLQQPAEPTLLLLRRESDGKVSFHVLSPRSEEHTSELQSLMRISYAVFCLKKKN